MRQQENTTFIFNYQSHMLKANVHFKKMKRILFRVSNGELVISAPYKTSIDEIKLTMNKLPPSFLKRLLKNPLIGDDYIYILGERKSLGQILEHPESDVTYKDLKDLERKLKSLALEILKKRVHYYEILMGIKNPYKVTIKKVLSQHGSNSRKTHTLSFSLSLIHYEMSVIDAVVVHELAHDRYFNHSKAFYDEIDKYYPEYKTEINKLKEGL